MKCGRLADFFFVGLGVLPVTLLLSGFAELAVMLFFPLLILACLCGAIDQVKGGIARTRDEAGENDGEVGRKDARGPKAEGKSRKAQE